MNFFENVDSKFYSEDSVLKISSLVKWKKKNNLYNFNELPETAFIVLNKKIIKSFLNPFARKLKGLVGSNYILNKNTLLCSEFGSGAPAITGYLEEFKELGVKRFIFVGLAGIINPNVKEAEVFVASKAYSTVGTSFFYSNKLELKPIDRDLYSKTKNALGISECECWSTDNPFRETRSLINKYKNNGASLVDMECAAIYAFSEFHKTPSVCVLIAADSLHDNHWNPPNSIKKLFEKQKEVISQLITI